MSHYIDSYVERPRSDCPSGKRSYPDERSAMSAMREVRRIVKGKPGHLPRGVYLCSRCSTADEPRWHMTSSKTKDPKLRRSAS